MKKILLFWAVVLTAANILSSAQAQSIDTMYKIGINWQAFDSTLDNNHARKLFDDTLGCNVYHSFYDAHNWYAPEWLHAGGATHLIVEEDGTISPYAASEMMIYQATKISDVVTPSDTLKDYFFINHHGIGSEYSQSGTPPWTHWEIPAATPEPGSCQIVLDSNQILDGPYPYSGMWRGNTCATFKMAVKFQVTSVTSPTADTVLKIVLHRYLSHYGDSVRNDLVYTWPILWNQITSTSDTVMFSPTTFSFPTSLAIWQNKDTLSDLKISIYAQRPVTTRLAWVTIQDLTADSLLAGVVLDTNVTALVAKSDTCKNRILRTYTALGDTLGSSLYYIYMTDEPDVAQFTSCARVNQLLSGAGEVERSNWQEARFAAQVQPKTFRSGNWNNWMEMSAAFDEGLGFGTITCYDSLYTTWNANTHHYDTTRLYEVGTQRNAGLDGYGYYPYRWQRWESPSSYALETSNSVSPPTASWECDTATTTGYSFDLYDYSYPLSNGSNSLRNVLQNDIASGLFSDSLVFLYPPPNGPKEWWANVFMTSDHKSDSTTITVGSGCNVSTYHDVASYIGPGGWYSGNVPSTPEQISAATNIAFATGAKGVYYWWGVTDKYANTIGFTKEDGTINSDSATYQGIKVPTLYKRNSLWLSKFSSWLKNYGQELYKKQWIATYARNWYGNGSTPIKFQDSLFVSPYTNIPVVNPSADSMTRPALKGWVTTDTAIHPDTIQQVTLPDSLRFVLYSCYKDTTHDLANPCYYLYAVNLWCDSRNLRCEWVGNADSALNHKYIMRGERELWTTLKLDSTIAPYWYVSVLDSTKWDTLVAAVSVPGSHVPRFCQHYFPGEGKIYKIHPAFNYHIAQGSIDYNNGRRMEYDSLQEIYHVTYYRNDSVFYRQSLDNTLSTWSAEYCIAAPQSSIFHCAHPSLRVLQNSLTSSSSVGIVYQVKDTSQYYVYLRVNPYGDLTSWSTPKILAQYPISHNVYEPTPVLAPFVVSGTQNLNGFITAWSQKPGIGLRAVNLNYTLSSVKFVSAVHHKPVYSKSITDTVSGFPTIMEDSTGAGFGLAFQQQSPGNAQIFFTTGTVSNPPAVTVDTFPDWASRIYGEDCDNEHPCIDRSQAMDIATPNVAQLTGGGGLQPWTAWLPNLGGGIHPSQRYVWNIVWDAPITLITYGGWCCVTTQTQNAIWQAMEPMAGAGSWVYNLFQPPNHNPDDYSYPSVRAFNGSGTTSNLASEIGWQTSNNMVLFANSLSAYPPATGTPNYFIHPLQESGIAETQFLSPPPTTTPNLELNSHANSWYNNQRAVYKDTRLPDIRVLAESISNLDTVGSWHWQGLVSYELKDTGSTCIQRIYMLSPPQVSQPDSLNPLPGGVRTQFIPLNTHTDSLAWKTGIIAVTDTIHVGASDSSMLFKRLCYSPDTVGFAGSIGSGQIRYYIEAASFATGQTLKTVDSLVIKTGNLKIHADSITANMSSLTDSVIFFRVRAIDTTTPRLVGIVAQAYSPIDTTSGTSGLAKQLFPSNIIPSDDNPIGLTIFPNPAKGTASILFSIPVEDANDVTQMNVYDALGRDVTMLVRDVKPAGTHIVEFDGTALPSGRYMVAIKTANHAQAKLMILTK
jgi:hypothetical protein